MVSDTLGELSFKTLVDLAPDASGVWLKVKDAESEEVGVLTVVTKRFNEESLVQLGKDGSGSYLLFSQMIMSTIYIMLSSVVLLWPLSLYFIKLSLSPLIATREKVAELSADSKTELLPEVGSGPELDNLYLHSD